MSQSISRIPSIPARLRPRDWLVQAWRHLVAARQEAAMRQVLAELDDHMLSDLGISRAQARFEADALVTADTLR